MRLPGTAGQINQGEILYDASGTITTASTAQLVLPKARSRSSIIIVNISSSNMLFEFGGARASATLSGTTIGSVNVTNAGFGYSLPPTIEFLGGGFDNGNQITPASILVGLPEWPAPGAPNGRPAKAHCVMTGAAGSMTVSSIVIDDPGSGYAYPPYVLLRNNISDPYGCAAASGTSGLELIAAGGAYEANGTITTTDQISVWSATQGAAFTCKFSI